MTATPAAVATGTGHFVSLAMGRYHVCGLTEFGAVYCWGRNAEGQLGDGTRTQRTTPTPVVGFGVGSAVAITAGSAHTCAISTDGSAKCWGDNTYYQLGSTAVTSSATPLSVGGLSNVVAIDSNTQTTCARLADGTVTCWGQADTDGSTTNHANRIAIAGFQGATSVQVGNGGTCARMPGGSIKCVGQNIFAGAGGSTIGVSRTPVTALGADYVDLDTGNAVCAVRADGHVYCWGSNFNHMLGVFGGDSSTPTDNVGFYGAKNVWIAPSIAGGLSHTCALDGDGTVRCWGDNTYGQLGDATFSSNSTPVIPASLNNVVAIAAGKNHTCALTSAGTVKCWGSNDKFQLGESTDTKHNAPAPVASVSNATGIAAGNAHTCALVSDGTVKCWGDNSLAQLGAATPASTATPTAVPGVTGALSIAAGGAHTCAVLSTGRVKCWGANAYGQIGDGTTSATKVATQAAGSSVSYIRVTCGANHSCGLDTRGNVYCWGKADRGQMGAGTAYPTQTTPALVASDDPGPVLTATAIAAGGDDTCLLSATGATQCWGDNMFQQLDSSSGPFSAYVVPETGASADAMGLGGAHVCMLLIDGANAAARCWGHNDHGQLGLGTVGTSGRGQVLSFP